MGDKVWKIRNKDGLWSNGGSSPTFSKTGKTWSNIGHVKSHLSSFDYRTYNRDGTPAYRDLPPEDWEIVEIEVRYDESSKTNVRDLVKSQRRRRELERQFGSHFSSLVGTLEDKNLQNEFQWVLIVGQPYRSEQLDLFTKLIKDHKLKLNSDYKKSVSNSVGSFAFKSKLDAMKLRLAFPHEVKSVDITQYVETNLDIDTN